MPFEKEERKKRKKKEKEKEKEKELQKFFGELFEGSKIANVYIALPLFFV